MFLFWTRPEEFPRESSSEPSRWLSEGAISPERSTIEAVLPNQGLAPPVKDKRHMPSGSFEAPRGRKCALLRPHGSVREAQ
ncbi:hypothetical protein CALCODRAFT_497628 [Calocera cornea HHB12733]|uniref:Uncharacterized protein n=1 Tax=Calocera cornea HHB12733 TaxID=1353952 RepID=A0A165F6Y2_9BASI|nr:hypothetical protein CALCODRAFT_497628 [Calocera cornea HHB12733]